MYKSSMSFASSGLNRFPSPGRMLQKANQKTFQHEEGPDEFAWPAREYLLSAALLLVKWQFPSACGGFARAHLMKAGCELALMDSPWF